MIQNRIPQQNFRLGRPGLRQVSADALLAELVEPDSVTLFQTSNVNTHLLAKPTNTWQSDAVIIANTFVRTVKVVDDAAERGVQLIVIL
jgi:hypothetical protein